MRSSDWLLPGPVSDDGRCIGAVCRAEFDQDEGLAAISKLSLGDDEATACEVRHPRCGSGIMLSRDHVADHPQSAASRTDFELIDGCLQGE